MQARLRARAGHERARFSTRNEIFEWSQWCGSCAPWLALHVDTLSVVFGFPPCCVSVPALEGAAQAFDAETAVENLRTRAHTMA